MGNKTAIGGHRGLGCTDHDFYQTRRDIAGLPVENTIASFDAAFRAGCDYVECDAVMSGDGQLFTLHNVVPADHFFGAEKPRDLLNRLPFDDIRRFGTGRTGRGQVAPFAQTLQTVANADPKTLPWCINIEIKGVQGSKQPYETNDYIARLAQCVRENIGIDRVLFSSFALQNIIAMSHELPQAAYGMLFAEKDETAAIYADHQAELPYQYLPFDADHAGQVMARWQASAAPAAKLSYFHPEFQTITAAGIELAKQHKAGLNSWALFEEMTPERRAAYDSLQGNCTAAGVMLTVITDYAEAF